MREISIQVRLKLDQYNEFAWHFDLPISMQEILSPIDVCDDPFMVAVSNRAMLKESERLNEKYKIRKDLAEYISKKLTDKMVEAINSQDTVNGYKIS